MPAWNDLDFIARNFPDRAKYICKLFLVRSPMDLNYMLSDLKAIRRNITNQGVNTTAMGPQTYRLLRTLIPQVEDQINRAISQGGRNLPTDAKH